jgi:hypothetical protein
VKHLVLAALVAISLGGFGAGSVSAQQSSPQIRYQPDPDSPIGTRNPAGPGALADYDFVIGNWDVEITFTPPGGQPAVYQARWHNHWILNGLAVMQEWRGPYATGAEIRSYNAQTQRWEGENIYPALSGGFRPTTSVRFDDRMEVVIEAADGSGPFLNRETYIDIEADSMRMYSELSRDGGETWQAGRYSMIMTRAD